MPTFRGLSVAHLRLFCLSALMFLLTVAIKPLAAESQRTVEARANAARYAEILTRVQKTIHAVLLEADPASGLIPDYFSGNSANKSTDRYSPHNVAADLYPFLVIGSHFTDPTLTNGKLLEMLRRERELASSPEGIPAIYNFKKQRKSGPSLFGAGEYAKDGLIAIAELLGRGPWHWRMHDMTIAAMTAAKVKSDFGLLPARGSELNGDFLQVLPRLFWMSGDIQFLQWGRRIADAYIKEVLPNSNYLPPQNWDFKKHTGDSQVRLRDHGNETIVGLSLMYAAEKLLSSERAPLYEAAVSAMFDRLIASTNEDGFFYDEIDARTLAPRGPRIADNWGYIYGAMYNLYLLTKNEKYLAPITKVLTSLSKYKNYPWEGTHYDGYADTIEGALYLLNRVPSPSASAWVDSEVQIMLHQQKADGHIDGSYLEGNYIRTALMYLRMKSQGIWLDSWAPGIGVGASNFDPLQPPGELSFSVIDPTGRWRGKIHFDYARHRRIMNLPVNLVRLNEFSEWFTVDENTLYALVRTNGSDARTYLGSELIAGIPLTAGDWIVRRISSGSAVAKR